MFNVYANIIGGEENGEDLVATGFQTRGAATGYAQEQQATRAPHPVEGQVFFFVKKATK